MKKELSGKLTVKDKDGNDEYYIFVVKSKKKQETRYTIFTSEGDMWLDDAKDEFLLGLIDNGNGLKIEKPRGRNAHFEYDEALYLMMLLNINNINSYRPETAEVADGLGVKTKLF